MSEIIPIFENSNKNIVKTDNISTKVGKQKNCGVTFVSQETNNNMIPNQNLQNSKAGTKELPRENQNVSKVCIQFPDRIENNNSKQWDIDKKRASPCTCIRYSQSNSCALKHRFGVRIHSDFSNERTSAKSKHEKVTFCDTLNNISTPGRPRQTSPTTYSEIIILDSPPAGHWPLKRSASLESRDNPFLPGGDLEKEADDILKRATIVRDRFFLDDGRLRGQALTSESVTLSESSPLYTAGNDTTVMEDSISPQAAASTNAAPDGKPRQNGKLEESSVSPASVKPEVGLDQIDGVTLTDDSTKDKKKQKKCCSIM